MFDFLMEEVKPRRKSWFGSYSWWKRRTGLEKILLTVSVLIITMLVVLQSVVLRTPDGVPKVHKVEDKNNSKNKSGLYTICSNGDIKVCITPTCVKAAASVLESLDTNTKPCDDFYRFACGNYIDKVIIPGDETTISTLTILTDQLQEQLRDVLEEPIQDYDTTPAKLVKSYYQACTNKNITDKYGIKILKDILKRIGGWPVLEGEKWKEKNFEWKELVYKFDKIGFETMPFIKLSVGTDPRNSSIRLIQLDEPEFELSKQSLMEGSNDKLTEEYFNLMVYIAVTLGCNESVAEIELKDSLQFEIQLTELSMSKEERHNISKLHNIMSVTELQKSYPGVSWVKFINNLLPSGVQIQPSESLILISPQYVANTITLIDQTPKRVQANYAIWRAIKQQIPYLTEDLRQRQLKYMSAINNITTENQTKWKECVDEVSKKLPILTSALYAHKYFPYEAKGKVTEMVQYIKEVFIKTLKSLEWMDEITKKRAFDKYEAMVTHIGYPDELLGDTKLEEHYKTLKIHPDQYLKSHLNIQIHSKTFSLKRLYEPVNKTDWFNHKDITQVDVFYDLLENSIMFPAGILQGSFFNKDRPNYMNYATIGWVIGHELIHGFDNIGSHFDGEGNVTDWWTQETKESFIQKAQCVIYQYENHSMTRTNEKLNGINIQHENIADNGGVKQAYLAYKTWVNKNNPEPRLPGLNYSPNQLFWISGAMNWCAHYKPEIVPIHTTSDIRFHNEFRVMGPFSNSEYFAKDFSCPVGSNMNPEHKCLVW